MERKRQQEKSYVFPVVQFSQKLGLVPAFVLDCKCTKWSIKPLKIEEKKVVYRNEERTLLRKTFKDFVVYYSSNSWINGAIYAWEMQRVSLFLKRKTPNTKYLIMVDNVPSHIRTEFIWQMNWRWFMIDAKFLSTILILKC